MMPPGKGFQGRPFDHLHKMMSSLIQLSVNFFKKPLCQSRDKLNGLSFAEVLQLGIHRVKNRGTLQDGWWDDEQ